LDFANLDSEALAQLNFPYESKAMAAVFQWDLAQNMKWNVSSANARSTGTMDPDGGVKGSLSLGLKPEEKVLEISGSRRTPRFSLLR
jgi:hypothetical protein